MISATLLIVGSISLILFALIGFIVLKSDMPWIDQFWINVMESIQWTPLHWVMRIFTLFGDILFLSILVLACMLYFIKYNKKKHVIALGMIYAGYIFVNQVFKRIIDRERPPVERIVEVTGSSFPSGHTMGAFAIYGTLLVFVLASKKMQPVQKWLIPLLASLPFAVALSRNYLGAHYMTDVLGAAFLSITVICYTLALPIFKKKKSQSPE